MVYITSHPPTQGENNLRAKITAFSVYIKCLQTIAHFIEKKSKYLKQFVQ